MAQVSREMDEEEEEGWAEQSLTLTMAEASRIVRLKVTTRPQRPMELLPVLQLLQNEIVSVSEEAAGLQGKIISCKAGCGACCRQLVPISEIEARYLARILDDLPPKKRKVVRRRFRAAAMALEEGGMMSRCEDGWKLGKDEETEQLGLDYFQLGIPCPFLEEESCSIHRDRPLACREFLVTSPAEHCTNPNPDTIEPVELPAQLSYLAYRFSDGLGEGESHWFPLTLALKWFEEHRDEEEPRRPGHEMLSNVLTRLVK